MPHPLLFARKMNPDRAECHRKTLATGIDLPGSDCLMLPIPDTM